MNSNQQRAFGGLLINLGIAIFVTFSLGPLLEPAKAHTPQLFMLWGIVNAVPMWICGIFLSK